MRIVQKCVSAASSVLHGAQPCAIFDEEAEHLLRIGGSRVCQLRRNDSDWVILTLKPQFSTRNVDFRLGKVKSSS